MIGTQTIKDVFAVETATSQEMQESIRAWSDLYLNRAPWLNQDVRGLNLPAAIAGEIARAVTLELRYRCMGSPRADFLSAQLEPVMKKRLQSVFCLLHLYSRLSDKVPSPVNTHLHSHHRSKARRLRHSRPLSSRILYLQLLLQALCS